jgi:hypothetical protein
MDIHASKIEKITPHLLSSSLNVVTYRNTIKYSINATFDSRFVLLSNFSNVSNNSGSTSRSSIFF